MKENQVPATRTRHGSGALARGGRGGFVAIGLAAAVAARAQTFTSASVANPGAVAPGGTSAVTTKVTNTSSVALQGGIVYTQIYDPAGTLVAQWNCAGVNVAPGASASCPFTWTAPASPGTYTLEVGVFGANWTPQYHWNNTPGTVSVTAPATPTFTSVASASPSAVAPGATTVLTTKVTNTSAVALANGIVYSQVYDPAGTLVAEWNCAGVNVAAGASASCPFTWTAPATAGTYGINVGVFGESWTPQYHWNDTPGSVSVTAPTTLTFTSVATASPSVVAPGGTAVLTTKVTNTSAVALANGIVYSQVYDPAGTLVAQWNCAGVNVAPGASASCPFTWTAPATQATYAINVGVFGANWTPQYHWNDTPGTVSVTHGGSSAAALAQRLGKPPRLLVGLGGGFPTSQDLGAAISGQGIHLDILEHYLVNLPDNGGWIDWTAPDRGRFVADWAAKADRLGAVPMFTLYQMADRGDGNIVGPLADRAFMTMYWESARMLFQRLGTYGKPALVNLEPDFWGYSEVQSHGNPASLVALVSAEGPECAGLPDNVAGFAQCLVTLARRLAPQAAVGFSPSPWGGASTQAIASYMLAVHAADADFIAIQTLDRDAGCFEAAAIGECQRGGAQWYWGPTEYQNHFAMAQQLHQAIGKPLIWWQTPLGVPSASPGGSVNAYRDNRVQTFFANPGQLVAAGAAAMVFGAGATSQTLITTDGGQFRNATAGYLAHPVALP